MATNNRIERVVICTNLNFFCEWNTEYAYYNKHRKSNESIFVVEKNKFMLGPWHYAKDVIRSVSVICDSTHSMNMTLEEFINIYRISYSTYFHSDENKIFIHCINKYLNVIIICLKYEINCLNAYLIAFINP